LSEGTVKCWGYNGFGELGDGTDVERSPIPVAVNANALGGSVMAITAGAYHSCALLDGGTVKCWGSDDFGELGDGNFTYSQPLPVLVQNLGGPAAAIAAGDHHTCAILVGGDVKCWGSNGLGQVGDGTFSNRAQPKSISLPAPATSLAAGRNHTCVASGAGGAWCWGDATDGQLGSGDAGSWPTPQNVRGDDIFHDDFEDE
jgi:alpha-tubulin suppressor-like RCC1 family protein